MVVAAVSDSLVALALGVGAAAVVLSGALLAVFLRMRAPAPREENRQPADTVEYLMRALNESDERVESLRALVERKEVETKRLARLGELRLVHDLDRLLDQTLDAGLQLSQSEAGVIIMRREGAEPLVRARGFSPEEEPRVLAGLPMSSRARSVVLQYDYASGSARPGELSAGVFVPLQVDTEELGAIGVFRRAVRESYSPDDLLALEELGREAVVALAHAQRYEEMKESAARDGLTSLYNQTFFHQQLAREVKRAKRYGRPLTVIVFDLDDFKAINDALGHLEADAVLGEVAARINASGRSADIAARVGGDEFAVIMPESRPADALHLFGRVQSAVSVSPTLTGIQVSLSAGVAEFQADDDGRTLFSRADRAVLETKRLGKGQCRVDSPPSVLHGDDEQITGGAW